MKAQEKIDKYIDVLLKHSESRIEQEKYIFKSRDCKTALRSEMHQEILTFWRGYRAALNDIKYKTKSEFIPNLL